jgi:hypothetical protein
MSFTNLIKNAGVKYIRHAELNSAIARNKTSDLNDLYILYFNEIV